MASLFTGLPDNVPVTRDQRHPTLPKEAMADLRDGLATCGGSRRLTPQAQASITSVCHYARGAKWTPEQLLVAVKDACYTSPEITQMTTTSERDAFLSKVVTACIQEFFRK